MIKLSCIIFVLFSALISVRCDDQDKNKTEPLVGEHSFFSAHYYHVKASSLDKKSEWLKSHSEQAEHRCPGYKARVEQADKKFEQCVKQTFEEYNHRTICEMAETFLQNCTTELVNAMEGCLPEHSKQLAVFIFKSFYSVTDYLCMATGETLLELSNPCLWKDVEGQHKAQLIHCEDKVKAIARKYRDNSQITTRNICSDLKDFKGCIKSRVETMCQNPKTRRAMTGLYDAAVAPCDKINHV